MRYELPSWMSIKSTLRVEGAGGGGGEGGLGGSEKNNFLVPHPLELHVWSPTPDPRPLGTFENQDGRHWRR